MNKEWILSADVESDGPVVGINSLLSLGAALFDDQGSLISKKLINFRELDGAKPDPYTMNWWAKFPDAWKVIRQNLVSPVEGIAEFLSWLDQYTEGQTVVCLGYRAAYDGSFLYYYLDRWGYQKNVFGRGGNAMIDLRSYACAKLGMLYSQSRRPNFPDWVMEGCPEHTHVPDQDAEEAGRIFFNLKKFKTAVAE